MSDGKFETLEAIAATYDPSDAAGSFDFQFKQLQASALGAWMSGSRVLELGCATGELASLISPFAAEYHIVEGSAHNIEATRARVPGALFTHSLWDDFRATTDYDDILFVNTLEHAPDPVGLMRRARGWLAPKGRIHAMVPNGLSLHRLIGVELGQLEDPLALSPADHMLGHFRNYTIESLLADIDRAGLRVEHWEGILLKPLSNSQMLDWDPELIRALAAVGQRFPEHCAVLYVVCGL